MIIWSTEPSIIVNALREITDLSSHVKNYSLLLLLAVLWSGSFAFIKIGVESVGPPFKGNQVKIANDGEILVKGENVMLGYWNKKEETEKVIINK